MQWGIRGLAKPLIDDMKASRTYQDGARPGESPAKFIARVKKNFHNSKLNAKRTPETISKYNARNNAKYTSKMPQALITKKHTTHNNLLVSTSSVQNVAWTDANPLDRDAAFASAFTKAVALVEAALLTNGKLATRFAIQ